MIRHIVMWKLRAEDGDGKAAAIGEIRGALEPLVGVIPGLRSLIVRADVATTDGNWDAVLVSEHDSTEALDGYQVHPEHVRAAAVPRGHAIERAVVDVVLD
jgi:hypothetical protein